MTEAHQNICRSLSLVYCKPYDIIYSQGDLGDSFYYILNGTVKQAIHKRLEHYIYPSSPLKRISISPNMNGNFNNNEEEEYQVIEVKTIKFIIDK